MVHLSTVPLAAHVGFVALTPWQIQIGSNDFSLLDLDFFFNWGFERIRNQGKKEGAEEEGSSEPLGLPQGREAEAF